MGILNHNKPSDSPEKKSFGETGFGKFLQKVKAKAPDIAADALDIIASGTPVKTAINKVRSALNSKANLYSHDKEYMELVKEIDKFRMDWEKEMYALEVQDRNSARNREIEIARTGKKDWMMTITGLTVLACFVFIVVSAVYLPEVFKENPVLLHIVGMIEGAALGVIYYFYGTSRSSSEKTKLLAEKMKDNG